MGFFDKLDQRNQTQAEWQNSDEVAAAAEAGNSRVGLTDQE